MNIPKSFVTLVLATLSAGLPAISVDAVSTYSVTEDQFTKYFQPDQTAFVAEGQIDNREPFQLALGKNTNNPATHASYTWPSGKMVSFTLNYTSSTSMVTFQVDEQPGLQLQYIDTSNIFINGIVLRTVAINPASTKSIAQLVVGKLSVNSAPLQKLSINVQARSPLAYSSTLLFPLDRTSFTSKPAFTLSGLSQFTFAPTPPVGSELSYQIWVGDTTNLAKVVGVEVPEPKPNPMFVILISVGFVSLYKLRRKQMR